VSFKLLPEDFEKRCADAVQLFWQTRAPGTGRQEGSRASVIGGKNMDGFVDLVRKVAERCGLSPDSVYTRSKSVTLPGFYRPTKRWDALVIDRGSLLAAFEFKSQVGSFGNNFNNRSEEAIGSAADLWVAYRHGAFKEHQDADSRGEREPDPRPPFVGWLMLLEDCEKSRAPVSVDAPHYAVFPEFEGASYARRYQVLCERLMQEKLYASASLVLSELESGLAEGASVSLSEATSLRGLFLEFASKVVAAVELRGR